MTNPWLKKNPFMSMWLSGAHSVANKAAGQARAQGQAIARQGVQQGANDLVSLWSSALMAPWTAWASPPATVALEAKPAPAKRRSKPPAAKSARAKRR